MRMRTLLPALALAVVATEASAETATTVYLRGNIYTANVSHAWADAMAVKDGRFIAVGTERQIKPYIGKDTQVVDLQGQTVFPGLLDGHAHYVRGLFDVSTIAISLATQRPTISRKRLRLASPRRTLMSGSSAAQTLFEGRVVYQAGQDK
jgi:predicted amidohydrolase YtcJ